MRDISESLFAAAEQMIDANPRFPGKPMGEEAKNAVRDFAAFLRVRQDCQLDLVGLLVQLREENTAATVISHTVEQVTVPTLASLPSVQPAEVELSKTYKHNLRLLRRIQELVFPPGNPAPKEVKLTKLKIAELVRTNAPDMIQLLFGNWREDDKRLANSISHKISRVVSKDIEGVRSSGEVQKLTKSYIFRPPNKPSTQVCQASPQ